MEAPTPAPVPTQKLSFLDFMTVDLTGQAGTQADPDGMLAWQYQKRHRMTEGNDKPLWSKGDVAEQNKDDDLIEALTTQQRLKRRILFKRIAPKIKLGKERASRRKANNTVLQKRAIAMARGLMAKKLLAGKSKGEVSFAERVRVEKLIAKRGKVVQRIATKLLPFLRKKEAAKFSSSAPVATAPTTAAN